jgi:integrase
MMLARIAAKTDIEKRVHPHGLRHTHALELASEGTPINTIQLQLGHGNASTTSAYIQKLAPQVVIETMQRRTWDGVPADPLKQL